MSNHTPGPWEVEYDELTEQWIVTWDDGFAEVGGLYADDKARLIAAAPELLSLLEVMLSEGPVRSRDYYEGTKLIAKAKGETEGTDKK